MSFVSGFQAGQGSYLGNKAQSMLEQEMTRYKGLSEVYKTIANNPDVYDDVRNEAVRRLTLLSKVDPNNPLTVKAVKGFEKTDDIWNAQDNIRKGQTEAAPSLEFKAAASGQPSNAVLSQQPQALARQPFAAEVPQGAVSQSVGLPAAPQPSPTPGPPAQQGSSLQESVLGQLEQQGIPREVAMSLVNETSVEAGPEPPRRGMFMSPEYKMWMENKSAIFKSKLAAWLDRAKMENKMSQLDMMGPEALAGGLSPDHPLYPIMIENNRQAFVRGKEFDRMQRVPIGNRMASYHPKSGRIFIGNQEVDAMGTPINAGQVSSSQITFDAQGRPVQTDRQTAPAPNQIALTNPGAGSPGGGGGIPALVAPPAPQTHPTNATSTPTTTNTEMPLVPGVNPILAQRFPAAARGAGDAFDTYAFQIASGGSTPDDMRTKAPDFVSEVSRRLNRAGIIPMETKEITAARDLRGAEQQIKKLSDLLDKIIQSPGGALWEGVDDQYENLRQAIGSILAKFVTNQVGALSELEQEWARAGFASGWKAVAGSIANKFGFVRWAKSAKNSLKDFYNIVGVKKHSWLDGRTGDYVPGIGPKTEFVKPLPLFGGGAQANRVYKMYSVNHQTGQKLGSDNDLQWFDVNTGEPYTP